MSRHPINCHSAYHAHVYFDADSVERAADLCSQAGDKFGVKVGRVHRRPVGPHPHWSCQLAFTALDFDGLIPWLDQQREDLSVLVHGLTGDDLADHTDHAYWLGEPALLKLEVF